LVFQGEAGIGKTALLALAADSAQVISVVRLEGIKSQMQLSYATLHRLLLPLLVREKNLPADKETPSNRHLDSRRQPQRTGS
jgi:hypothetical protein